MSNATDSAQTVKSALLARFSGTDLWVDEDQAKPLLSDWRNRYHGKALAVAMPRHTSQVSELLSWCHQHRVAVVPQGGNTGLVGGATPDDTGLAILLSTKRLNKIRQVDPVNQTMTLEAGCTLQQAQEQARQHQRLFPLSLASEGTCTLGGNLATNAGGTQVLRYGNARDLTLGLEVVLPDGQIWHGLRGLRKDNTGIDLKQLFIGAEGTLGVITAATVKLFPMPRQTHVAWLALPNLHSAQHVLQLALDCGGPAITAFELVSQACMQLLARTLPNLRQPPFALTAPWQVLIEWSDMSEAAETNPLEGFCTTAAKQSLIIDAVVANSSSDAQDLWQLRERLPEAQTRAGGNVKHDISLPISAIDTFVQQTVQKLALYDPHLQTYIFGHLGDGNLHFNVGTVPGAEPFQALQQEAQINAVVYAQVQAMGGSVSAEHGLGQLRRNLAAQTKSSVELNLMRAIKLALDPLGIMNPGKSLPL